MKVDLTVDRPFSAAVSSPLRPVDPEPTTGAQPAPKAQKSAPESKPDPRPEPRETPGPVESPSRSVLMQGTKIQFELDPKTGDLQITVLDKESGDVIRQIPPEEIANFSRRFSEVIGLFVDKQV